MATTADTVEAGQTSGLFARAVGILLAPRDTYAEVAARPRWLGMLLLVLAVSVGAQLVFVSTEAGSRMMIDQALEQQVRALESSGRAVSDETYAQMERQLGRLLPVLLVGGGLVTLPLTLVITSALLLGVFSTLLGGNAGFRQVFAVVTHATVILALQALFTLSLSYAQGHMAGANLGLFFPMLRDTSFAARLLATLDVFLLWTTFSMAIGVGVLYKRRTGPVAAGLFTVYGIIAVLIAFVRSG